MTHYATLDEMVEEYREWLKRRIELTKEWRKTYLLRLPDDAGIGINDTYKECLKKLEFFMNHPRRESGKVLT